MARFGFCGPAYASRVLSSDAQVCMNLILEKNESGASKSDYQLLNAPGTKVFGALAAANGPARPNGALEINGRAFEIYGSKFIEVFADGTSILRGDVGNDGLPVSLAASNIQIMIASAGNGYCFTLATSALSAAIANLGPVVNPTGGVIQVGYSDGYFVALLANSQTIQLSGLLDGLTWDPLQKAVVSVFPGIVRAMIVDHREICLLGDKQSVCYYDSGNSFPYDVIPGGFMEQGSASAFGKAKADNSYFWWGKNEDGQGIGWRAQGYTPTRVSTHAIEKELGSYPTIADAVSWTYQEDGHIFWVTYFPTANKTWVYDISNGTWSQRGFWQTADYVAHRSCSHMFAFGKHLVGDWGSKNVLEQKLPTQNVDGTWNFRDDFGNANRWLRRSPYVASEGRWMYFGSVEFDGDWGLGIPVGQGSDPKVMLRWSNDRAKSWSDEIVLSIGKVGEYAKRVIARRLGKCWGTIGRVFELSGSDPVPIRITDAYLEGVPDMQRTPRLADKLRAQA